MGPRTPRDRRCRLADDDRPGRYAPVVADLVLWDGPTIFFYSKPDTPKLRNLASSSRVSFTLRSDEYADHYLVIEGTAAVDDSIEPSDVHPAYQAKYVEPLAHWGMDEAQTAGEFSVPIRITPSRVRVG